MTCKPVTAKQKRYASSLVGDLLSEGHRSASRYDQKVNKCKCIREMSDLIGKMKESLAEDDPPAPNSRRW